MRKPGFYKVQHFHDDPRWSVAEWDGNYWTTCGDLPALTDSYFAEIGDRIHLPGDEE